MTAGEHAACSLLICRAPSHDGRAFVGAHSDTNGLAAGEHELRAICLNMIERYDENMVSMDGAVVVADMWR